MVFHCYLSLLPEYSAETVPKKHVTGMVCVSEREPELSKCVGVIQPLSRRCVPELRMYLRVLLVALERSGYVYL